jgi:hypothetical protein
MLRRAGGAAMGNARAPEKSFLWHFASIQKFTRNSFFITDIRKEYIKRDVNGRLCVMAGCEWNRR